MAGRHRMPDRVEPHAHVVEPAALERLDLAVTVAVGQIEEPARDQERRAVRRHSAEPNGDERLGAIRLERQLDLRKAEDVERLLERFEREAHRARVLRTLVGRPVALTAVGTPRAGVGAGRLSAADTYRELARQRQLTRVDRRRGPLRLGHPAARPLGVVVGGRQHVLDPGAQRGLVHDPGVDALEPVVPPAQALLEEADRRAGLAVLREGVRPGPDKALARAGQACHEAGHRIRVAVRPASDRVDGRLDLSVVLAHRSLAPVVVAALMPEPGLDVGRCPLHALEPGLPPALAHRRGIGRLRAQREHRRRPLEHVDGEHAAADVVHVVRVAVVTRAHRDHGLQGGRPARRDLQPVEAAPGDADHAHRSAAPGLLGEPGDHL